MIPLSQTIITNISVFSSNLQYLTNYDVDNIGEEERLDASVKDESLAAQKLINESGDDTAIQQEDVDDSQETPADKDDNNKESDKKQQSVIVKKDNLRST